MSSVHFYLQTWFDEGAAMYFFISLSRGNYACCYIDVQRKLQVPVDHGVHPLLNVELRNVGPSRRTK